MNSAELSQPETLISTQQGLPKLISDFPKQENLFNYQAAYQIDDDFNDQLNMLANNSSEDEDNIKEDFGDRR